MSGRRKCKQNQPQPVADGEIRYPWLPVDDEANVIGYYVPTPDAIERHLKRLRRNHRGRGYTRQQPLGPFVVPTRRHAFDGVRTRE